MIPDSVVEEVRARADIVDIVGEQVTLKRAGKDFKGLCPFHHEKTPSFFVVPAKNIYTCFGCGAVGDAFSFLMKKSGLSFQEAVREIANKVGVEIPETTRGRPQDEPNRPLYEAIAFANDFFQHNLWEEAAGEKARRYLEGRGLERKAAEKFGLGYAPDGWRVLREAAQKHGIEDPVLLAAGLIKEVEGSGKEPYDRFRDRLMFPIAEASGRVVAFGGRVIGPAREGAPKYLNSPESAIYQKGRLLYGINWAKNAIRREKKVLLVEGNMDMVSLGARGIDNVVAGLGTALTDEQAQLIARYAKQAILLYDSDAAGLKATFRSGDTLLRAGVEPLVVTLPAGEDPDSLVRKGGPQMLAGHIGAAVDVLDRKMQILDERGFFGDIEGIRNALDRLLPTIRATTDEALRDIYVARVAERTGVRRETIERELRNTGRSNARVEEVERAPRPEQAGGRGQARTAEWAAERMLLQLMLRDPARVEQAASVITPEHVRDPVHRRIFELLLEHGSLPADPPAELGLNAVIRDRLNKLHADRVDFVEGDRAFDAAVGDLMVYGIILRLDDLKRRLSLAGPDEQEALQRQETELHAQLRELGARARLGYKASPRYRQFKRGRAQRPEPPTGGD